MLIDGVIGVGDCSTEEIAKHGGGLIEGDLVFAEIRGRFGRIPFKLHASSLAGSDRRGHWDSAAAQWLPLRQQRRPASYGRQSHGTCRA